MPEDSATPTIIAPYQGKIAIYSAMLKNAYRTFWDPATKQLTMDKSWVASYLAKGQTVGDAPTFMGNWIVIQTNGIGSSTKASSLVAINVDDASNIQTIYPFGQLQSGQKSFAPPKPQGDLENNMVYSADGGVGKIAGIHLDPSTGKMTTKWTVDDRSFEFQPLYGSADEPDHRHDPMEPGRASRRTRDRQLHPAGRVARRRDRQADRDSDYLPPIGLNGLVAPAYGGRFVYPAQSSGSLYFLQPMPASSQPPVPTATEG